MLRTPLYSCHVDAGGRMVEFAGYELPVQYEGVLAEHEAVRKRCGLFDVSHMGEVWVRGEGALEFLQSLTPNDVARLQPGRAHYNALLREDGTFLDDLLVYCVAPDGYLLVVNAAFAEKDLAWLESHRPKRGVEIEDRSEQTALLALQGPLAERILTSTLDREIAEEVSKLRYYSFLTVATDRFGELLVSRTGYTGEDGFELYVDSGSATELWQTLLETGGEDGLVPAGLGARDVLRLEAGMMLSGQDIDESITPVEAGLNWIVKWKKGDFIGRDALERIRGVDNRQQVVGFRIEGRAIARTGCTVQVGGVSGPVTSGGFSPVLSAPIGLARLPRGTCSPGDALRVQVRKKELDAVVVDLPFYRRPGAS